MLNDELVVVLQAKLDEVKAENDRLRTENDELRRQLVEALQRIATLEQHIAALEGRRSPPPSFVKPNRHKPTEAKKPRRKRDAQHNHGRHRGTPTQIVQHAMDYCPECHYRLRGDSIDYVRQVMDIPPPQPVEVIEHRVIKRFCPSCGRWRSPRLDLRGQVIGQGRIGVRSVSLMAYLHEQLRLPVRAVVSYLDTIHQMGMSTGGVIELLHKLRRAVEEDVAGLRRQIQESPIVHADETGWRENGRNGYVWSFSTPGEKAVRYFEFDHSRGGHVAKRIVGDRVRGHLVTDFYSAYNDIAGGHQRCWVHMLRDLHELKERHPQASEVQAWALAVGGLYDTAKGWLDRTRGPTEAQRNEMYRRLVGQSHQLGQMYAAQKGHPCQALARRILRHEGELFQFVLVAGLSADNNLAERSLRPLVVVRKVSGGTRSDEGTQMRMGLASLFGTWSARKLNPFEECFGLLSSRGGRQSSL